MEVFPRVVVGYKVACLVKIFHIWISRGDPFPWTSGSDNGGVDRATLG
jgi:hypothetical protein